jgi:ABC-2 type transport system permease protein
MTFLEVFRLEFGCQARRPSTWLYWAVLFIVAFISSGELASEYARMDESFANGPFLIAVMMLAASTAGLLIIGAVAGEAAARDTQTRMASLVYTTPIAKRTYLGGRFLAALAMYVLVLSAVPIGQLCLAALTVNGDPSVFGPFRADAYVRAALLFLLPNAFVATTLAFCAAALSRRAVVAYAAGMVLLGGSALAWGGVAMRSGQWELAKLLDPLGLTVLDELSKVWAPAQRSTQSIAFEGAFLWNRILWISIACAMLALAYRRFRMAHHISSKNEAGCLFTSRAKRNPASLWGGLHWPTRLRQFLAIASDSFQFIVRGWGAVVLVATAAFLAYSGIPIAHMGVPLVATTERIIAFLATPLARLEEVNWIILPLLIVYYAGELVWRERGARLSDIADTAPVSNAMTLLGKLAGLSLVLAMFHALLMLAGLLIQTRLVHGPIEIGLFARAFLGLQLADTLLFGLLALVIHTLVNQKYVGHLLAVVAYSFMAFAQVFGVEHKLLIYGSDLGWMYSDMRRFGPFVAPWIWFKVYWGAWAMLLAVAATLFWVRGRETGFHGRLALARARVSRRTGVVALAAAGLALTSGAVIFYNTNVLNAYVPLEAAAAARAEYERRYGKYKDIPQPRVTALTMRVELHPQRGDADVHGTLSLVNATDVAIGAIHVVPQSRVETTVFRFDRSVKDALVDSHLGHRIYQLDAPLQPGESVTVDFDVRLGSRGFANSGVDASVSGNGSYLPNMLWLPAIGYQPGRELQDPAARSAHGLPPRDDTQRLENVAARHDSERASRIMVDTTIGTDVGQVAVAPGRLRRAWADGGRAYFHYVTDAPIRNDFALLSAAYVVRDVTWRDVSIQLLHHPSHSLNAERTLQSVQASLDYYTRQFGPYPHRQIRIVERPGGSVLLHAGPTTIDFEEAFALLNPEGDLRRIDLPFAVIAHEVAHQWWGGTLIPAEVEGAALLTESLAWFSAFGVVEEAFGPDHLQRLLGMMREVYAMPLSRASVPLLRANDRFLAYRKGPFAMYALREYIGADRLNAALRRFLDQYGGGTPPLPTTLDLYRELQAATPASSRPLLADLFETNTFWELATQQVAAAPTPSGAWHVVLDVRARKVVVDIAGVETEVPMDDLVEVGAFAANGDALYLQKHRMRSGEQRITLTVPAAPARAGIDPRSLLIDVKSDDNLKEIRQ